VVDSIVHPEHKSFVRFDYPSSLPEGVQRRMHDVCRRTVLAQRLEATAFNVELFYDAASDRIAIIEVNPRLCGQFGDLYEKVDGFHGYALAAAVACGERPALPRGRGRYRRAASVPLRVYEDAHVARAPTADDVRAAEALFPGTLVWNEVHDGQDLGALRVQEDGVSVRYAVLALGGEDLADIERRTAAVRARLGHEFTGRS
jgi:biotin carboxylase